MPWTDDVAETQGAGGLRTLAPEVAEPNATDFADVQRSTLDTLYRQVRNYNADLSKIAENKSVGEALKFVAHAVWLFCEQRGITDYNSVRMENATLTRDGKFVFNIEEQRPI
jgi:hypothetical protein